MRGQKYLLVNKWTESKQTNTFEQSRHAPWSKAQIIEFGRFK